ncbi:MAG: hypothetical protein RIC35_16875 [Marinoscillum sp.]
MDQLSTAFTLLGIGMITVFVVLSLVVITGNLLIRFVNILSVSQDQESPSSDEDPGVIAAITAAVEIVTRGKGRIKKIERKK